ncbi:MAG TPA: glycerate kinase [Ornithinimicrobium sp.]|nr:glycerate kinase [Ornithinimicrobium sp.]
MDRGDARGTGGPDPSEVRRRVLVVAPDKFRGSLTAPEVVAAVTPAAEELGWHVRGMPFCDGGEGMLDAFGGATRTSVVTGPHGRPVEVAWRLGEDGTAVVESALASGLALAGGAAGNDPLLATSRGTGELVAQAVRAGARTVVVGLGGSATTDGGRDAVAAVLEGLDGRTPLGLGVDLVAACDVTTVLTDAARVFGPQKGATPEQVEELTRRLERVQAHYLVVFGERLAAAGVHLPTMPGGGAAGGLGAGLVALGGRLAPGFDVVAEHVGLDAALDGADAVLTGEGALDEQSFRGKVVGGVTAAAERHGIPVVVLVGTVRPGTPVAQVGRVSAVDLSARFGAHASWNRTAECLARATREQLLRL